MNNQGLEKLIYRTLWLPSTAITRSLFNFQIRGKENLPKESAILIANHCVPLDGFLISSIITRQIHFWIQYENIYNTKFGGLFESFGEIPVRVESRDNRRAIKDSVEWLTKTRDYVAVFPEGPMKDLSSLENPYGGAAYLAYLTKKDIVPIGIYVPEKQKTLLTEKGSLKGFNIFDMMKEYLKVNGLHRIDYHINIGKAINISDFKKPKKEAIKELTEYGTQRTYKLAEEARNKYK